ncbi:glycosyltransferase family 2 protein [Vogesella oryzae]|uniref:glycosyltransferase family 2 protein n=1 Tax=Vogesella oryzae TaxID=1735285 RepID=UPI0015832965|nr:glycosyltransferase family 2 protein [Vogesella oryzae]
MLDAATPTCRLSSPLRRSTVGMVPRPETLAGVAVSCIVPGLNEHDNLAQLLPQLSALLEQLGTRWEIIMVDDGSTDATPQLMAQWTQRPGFGYVQLSRNFGKEAALSAGLEAAQGEVVILLDSDMQHPISLIPVLLSRWLEGYDNVYAVRENRDDEGPVKRMGSSLFYGLLSSTRGVRVPPHAGDFRLLDRTVVDALLRLPERTRFMKGLYAWVGFASIAVDYTPDERLHGSSHYSMLRLLRLAFDGLTAFTTWPLRMVSLLGFLLAMLSVAYGLYLVVNYFMHEHPLSGWTTIVTLQLFSAGIILISIGIVGEYLARVFDEVKGRPLYLVRQHLPSRLSAPAHDKENE